MPRRPKVPVQSTKPSSMIGAEPSTTLSARFGSQEVARLESAAHLKQWSVAQLVRVGAVEKAICLQNSSGRARLAVDSFISELFKQLFQPEFELEGDPNEIGQVQDHMRQCEVSCVPSSFNERQMSSLIKVARSLGTEFAAILEDAYRRKMHLASATLGDLIDPSENNDSELGSESCPEPRRRSESE